MITTLAAAILATTVAAGPPLDTTLAVRPGIRLEVNNYVGDIAIVAWGKNAVRIEAGGSTLQVSKRWLILPYSIACSFSSSYSIVSSAAAP